MPHPFSSILVSILLALLLPCSASALPTIPVWEANQPEESQQPQDTKSSIAIDDIETELIWDAYYTSYGIYLPLADEQMVVLENDEESLIYETLILDSLIPRHVYLEASIYPMPLLGTYIRNNNPEGYDNATIGGVNWIQAVTAGFEEPWAASLFLGNVVKFTDDQGDFLSGNRGHVGYLFSTGAQHIKDNVLIDDHWYEFEWKVKGDRDIDGRNLSWSFRVGTKLHDNSDIADVYHIGIKRQQLDLNASPWSFWDNADIDYQVSFDTDTDELVEQELTIGKKWPVKSWGAALGIDVGFIARTDLKYSGSLDDNTDDDVIFVIRPNLVFD